MLTPRQSVPFLKERVRPASALSRERIERWVADLDADRFAVRERAMAELLRLGELAELALQQALAGRVSAKVRRRVEDLLRKLGPAASPEWLRALRAVEVPEQVGTADARRVLEELARGAPEARLTREAKPALERLARRSAAAP